jgi:cytochrome c oxidase cbb3-type subunit 2
MYDHPHQWGSKRTGPDLARVGGKYSDEWHTLHMSNPRAVVPESVMPGYGWLATRKLDGKNIADTLKTLRAVGVPYSDEMVAQASADFKAQVDPDDDGAEALQERYPKAQVRQFDGNPEFISEMDALIAYLQMLGTLVDFTSFDASGPNLR